MKRVLTICFLILLLCGCHSQEATADIAATTLPVYEFTLRLCEGTPITLTRLVTEEVSCLHDYSLSIRQLKAAEAASCIVISGAGLEEFIEDILDEEKCIDASESLTLLCPEEEHSHDHKGHDGHHHENDPHIWLSPENAVKMAENICAGLSRQYPAYTDTFINNLSELSSDLYDLHAYGIDVLSDLSCRELITFHDGFSYFADAFDLTILEAVEEESGSEASAKELIHLIEEVNHHNLPAIFIEKSGSTSAAGIISRETGCRIFTLDMAMSGESYFAAMYHNINTVKEALQ